MAKGALSKETQSLRKVNVSASGKSFKKCTGSKVGDLEGLLGIANSRAWLENSDWGGEMEVKMSFGSGIVGF